ncbi:LysR substrate-binding domain-containing protein [Achromobacter insolitus]|uniref:HTH-type transcriptional regulator TsaR n=1 Tax=Achromobacter insolitus TaxID=217204 RepID=A0A6S7FD48_9BURK|nr:LysR substrate-binding domain-containing protein [Achromobacter insolitus]OAD13233.1 LysR family transcriptional regulator [Achromobacter insolitus]CAB3936853.1 HTH-type transcriptional regulator TsaR [Achromobacter insolitus]CAB3946241.1 HTH-type transcriptional regulator TsaR [Achromobacter insolitus]
MKPNQLHAFVAVATQRSIRAAARSLGVSAPAVTKIVRELERELDAPLVERSVKGIQLTDCGAALLPRARLLLDDLRRAREEVAQLRDGNAGQVRMAVSAAFAQTLFVPAFQRLRERRPGVSLHVSEAGPAGMLARLREPQVDFAVMHADPELLQDEFICLPLFPVRLVVGMRKQHPLRNRRSIRDLLDAEWALPGDGGDPLSATTRLFAALDLPVPRRVVQGDSLSAALALVSQTDHIGLFIEPLAKAVFGKLGIRLLEPEDPLPILQVCVIHRRGSELTPAARQFIVCLREILEEKMPSQ